MSRLSPALGGERRQRRPAATEAPRVDRRPAMATPLPWPGPSDPDVVRLGYVMPGTTPRLPLPENWAGDVLRAWFG